MDMDCHSVKGAVRPGELKFLNGRHRRAHWTSLHCGAQSGRTNAPTQAVAPPGGLMLSCLEGDNNESKVDFFCVFSEGQVVSHKG